jgi:hypothetical protein
LDLGTWCFVDSRLTRAPGVAAPREEVVAMRSLRRLVIAADSRIAVTPWRFAIPGSVFATLVALAHC